MGFMFVIGECGACGRLFTYSPSKVPVSVMEGERIPICEPCVKRLNTIRKAHGMSPCVIPDGAYEPEDEGSW
jgi:hypothetical protein